MITPIIPYPIHFKYCQDASKNITEATYPREPGIEDWAYEHDNYDVTPSKNPTELSNILHKNQPRLGLFDKKSVRQYTQHSRSLNKKLINNVPLKFSEHVMAKRLDNLTKNLLKHDLHVYSGVGFHPGALTKDSDGVFHSPSYISTTHRKSVASLFAKDYGNIHHIIHFHLKPGDKAYHLGQHSEMPDEYETILPRNQKFKINPEPDKYRGSGNTRYNVWHATAHHEE